MNLRHLLLPVSLTVMLGSALPVAALAATENAPNAKPAAVAPAAPDRGLKKDMPAAEVRKLLGEPAEVRVLKAPSGKAEVWVFVREISHTVDRIPVSTPDIVTSVTDATGHSHTMTVPGETRFQTVHTIVEETTEVLMFNDHFVTGKVSRAKRQSVD